MSFVKLDSGIVHSSLWPDREARELFITALCMAVPHELTEDTPALSVRSLDHSGFVVPAGWYGHVKAAGTGIVRQACVDPEPGMDALERLSMPDPDSRTPDNEGRRLVRIKGGWIVLNYDLYRQRDQTAAERSKRYRERNRHAPPRTVTRDDRDATANVTEVEVEVEVEGEGEGDSTPTESCASDDHSKDFLSLWNAMAATATLPRCNGIQGKRRTAFRARMRDPVWRDSFPDAIAKIPASRFLTGRTEKSDWKATIDWFLKADSLNKIIEGSYDDNSQDLSIASPDDSAGRF